MSQSPDQKDPNEKKPEGRGSGDGGPGAKKPKGMGGIFVIFLLILALFFVVNQSGDASSKTIYDFWRLLYNGQLETVEITRTNQLVGIYVDAGKRRRIEATFDKLTDAEREAIRRIQAYKVDPRYEQRGISGFLEDLENGRIVLDSRVWVLHETETRIDPSTRSCRGSSSSRSSGSSSSARCAPPEARRRAELRSLARQLLQQGDHDNVTFDDVAGIDEAKEEVRRSSSSSRTREVPEARRPHPPRRAARRPARHRQDAARQGHRRRGRRAVLLDLRLRLRRDVRRRRREPRARPVQAGPAQLALHHLPRRDRRRRPQAAAPGSAAVTTSASRPSTQILVEMDGFDTDEGIIVIAATNRPDVLDPALLRPGRFDRQVTIDLPDVKGREEILKRPRGKVKLAPDVDYGELARATPGSQRRRAGAAHQRGRDPRRDARRQRSRDARPRGGARPRALGP
jgi:hypothetical protein